MLLPARDRESVLAVFVVLSGDADEPDHLELKAFCLEALPDYMVPQEICVLDVLPSTVNGKVDRAALIDLLPR